MTRGTSIRTVLLGLVFLVPLVSAAQSISIQLTNNTEKEQQAKTQLERVLSQYETSHYTFTHEVIIEQGVIPHSHPELTLNARHLHDDDRALSTYLHEQIHWFLTERQRQTNAAEQDLMRMYPNPPVGGREGSHDLQSDYVHLLVCEVEREADLKFIGPERTNAVMQFWTTDHYTWIYSKVLADHDRIQAVIQRHKLEIR
jgi:hypothetical protein